MKKTVIALSLLCFFGTAQAQKKGDKKPAKDGGFTTLPSGLQYKKVKDAPGDNVAGVGDFIDVNIVTVVDKTSKGDSILYSSADFNGGKPVQFQMQPPGFKGDITEGLMMMTPGDSFVFRMSIDSAMAASPAPAQPWMKKNADQYLYYRVSLVSMKKAADVQREQAEAAGKQMSIDEEKLQAYFKEKGIKAQKTASGLYYKIDVEGKGAKANPGDTVVANYTGMTLNGTKFDSNVDPQFQHVEPFTFAVGKGFVIKGWDEGFQLFKSGSKGTLYIPSPLAYGERGAGGSIGANEVLIFDVEMVDVKPAK